MPLTLFKSSALRNGRAAIIRAAITWPIPGTVVSSFSVAVLISTLPSGVFSFACDLLDPAGLFAAIGVLGVGIAEAGTVECAGRVVRGCFCSERKTLKAIGLGARAFNRPALTPHPPIFSRLASSSKLLKFLYL